MGARLGAEGPDGSPEPLLSGAGWERGRPPPQSQQIPRQGHSAGRTPPSLERAGAWGAGGPVCAAGPRPAWRWVPSVPPWPLPRPAWDRGGGRSAASRSLLCALNPPQATPTPPPGAAEEGRAGQIPFISPISHYIRRGPYLCGASVRPPGQRAFYARGRACPLLPAAVWRVWGVEGP